MRTNLLAMLPALALVACGAPQFAPTATEAPTLAATSDGALSLTDGIERAQVGPIEVVIRRVTGNPVVYASISLDVGSDAFTSAVDASATSLALAAMADGGPASSTRDAFLGALDGWGASMGGGTNYDGSGFSLSVVGAAFDDLWPLAVDTFFDPALRDDEIERAREMLVAGLASRWDDPDDAVVELVRETFFAGHPYAIDPDGTEEAMTAVTAEQVRAAAQALRAPGRIRLYVVGNVDTEAVLAPLRRWVADDAQAAPSVDVAPFARDSSAVATLDRPGLPTNYVLGYFGAPSLSHADYPALEIALSILDDRLFEEVRTERNLSYAVSAGLATRRANSGVLYVTANDVPTTVNVMIDTLEELIATPVSQADLDAELAGYMTSYFMALESNGAQAGLLSLWDRQGGGIANANTHIARLREVTPDDVSRVLDTWVRNIQWGVVGDASLASDPAFGRR